MAIVCPTVTAFDLNEYRVQMERLTSFARRIHIDLMDGEFAPTLSPPLDKVWWPPELIADVHLMYQHPMDYLGQLVKLKPHMVIVHNEAELHHMHFAAELHKADIKAGLAILRETPIEWAHQIMHSFDQVLIFSGDLGKHGGVADLALLEKVRYVREQHPEVEIAWDGGISDLNAGELVEGGVQVLNTGGFIQNSPDPQAAYATLEAIIQSV